MIPVEMPVAISVSINALHLNHLEFCDECGTSWLPGQSCSCPRYDFCHSEELKRYVVFTPEEILRQDRVVLIQDFWGESVHEEGNKTLRRDLLGVLDPALLKAHSLVQHAVARGEGGHQRYLHTTDTHNLRITVLALTIEGEIFTHSTFATIPL